MIRKCTRSARSSVGVELPRSGAHGKDQQLDLRIEQLVSCLNADPIEVVEGLEARKAVNGGEEVQQRLVGVGGYPSAVGCLRGRGLGRPLRAT